MKILLLDIETAPNVAHVWGLWQQNVGLPQILESGYVLCWSAKWYGSKKTFFDSIHDSTPKQMLKGIYNLLSQADVVVHYNGQKFDIPTLNKEFVINGINPPAPYKQVDLLQVVRNQFRFASNKLAYVAKALGLKGKYVNPYGHELWVNCMAGDSKSWEVMETYNRQDVAALEELYNRLMPWIKNHPNHGAYGNKRDVCPNCGGSHFHKRGYAVAFQLRYPRLQCQSCFTWFRSNKAVNKSKEQRYVGV